MVRSKVFKSGRPVGVVFNCHVNGLGIIRSLGEKGIPVLGLDCSPRAIGLYSRYCYRRICPDPAKSQRGFVDFLLETGEALRSKGVLFPTNDKWLIAISKYRQELEPYYLFPMSNDQVIQKCVDKVQMYTAAEQLGIPIPRTVFCQGTEDLKDPRDDIGYPCIIKARVPPDFDGAFSRRVFRVDSRQDMVDWLQKNESVIREGNLSFLIQEVIPGDATGLYTFSAYSNRRAEVVAFSVIRKIKQSPPDFGTIVIGRVERQARVIELGTQLLRSFGFYGLSNTEFKLDPRDGDFKLMEINARSGMSIYYTTRSGVNLPYLAYREAVGDDPNPPQPQEGAYGAIWVVPEFRWLTGPVERVARWVDPSRIPAGGAPGNAGDMTKGRVINSVFQARDPLPYVILFLERLSGLSRGGLHLLRARLLRRRSQ